MDIDNTKTKISKALKEIRRAIVYKSIDSLSKADNLFDEIYDDLDEISEYINKINSLINRKAE